MENFSEMDKTINCLALELPEQVWNDLNVRWKQFKQGIGESPDELTNAMTKEEILKKHLDCGGGINYIKTMNGIIVPMKHVYKAMEEYANQFKQGMARKEEAGTIEAKLEFYRNETDKLRTYVFNNNIGAPCQSIFQAAIDEMERLRNPIRNDVTSEGEKK